jgi:hypothetical protein
MTYTRFILLIGCFLVLKSSTFAQDHIDSIISVDLKVERDVRLDSLLMRHIRVNEAKDAFEGYRLQLFSGSGTTARMDANALRIEFIERYPNVPAYLIYQAPNFKVRVGDLRTELEAIRLQRDLAYRYPGAFVIRDDIKFPILEIDREKDSEDEIEGEREIEFNNSDQKSSNDLERSDDIPKKK